MQQAANLQQATILQAAALSAATQNVWNQQPNTSQTNTSNDLSKSNTDAQQSWMQQWYFTHKFSFLESHSTFSNRINAGYDASQIAAYQQWYSFSEIILSFRLQFPD
jgi:hypothetical protein